MTIQLNCGRCGKIIKYVTAKEVRDKYSGDDEVICGSCQKFDEKLNEGLAKLENKWIKEHDQRVMDFKKALDEFVAKLRNDDANARQKLIDEQLKLEKKQQKASIKATTESPGGTERTASEAPKEPIAGSKSGTRVPWYKNPEWVRAIVGIVSVIIAVIAIIISLYY